MIRAVLEAQRRLGAARFPVGGFTEVLGDLGGTAINEVEEPALVAEGDL